MASSNQGKPGGSGSGSHAIPRGFASKDPERQREIPGDDDLDLIDGPDPAAKRKGTGGGQPKQRQQRPSDVNAGQG